MSRIHLFTTVGVLFLVSGLPLRGATVGFTEDFNSGIGDFQSGSELQAVHTSGGVGGSSDGFLELGQSSFAFHLGVQSQGMDFTGDLVADGVTGFSLWLNELGTDDGLEIHIGVGAALANFWLSVDGFAPPTEGWAQFGVDITDESGWVQIQGSGTFEDALRNSNRLLIRHDVAPFGHIPDATLGNFGVDRITVVPEPGSLLVFTVAALVGIRRRHPPVA